MPLPLLALLIVGAALLGGCGGDEIRSTDPTGTWAVDVDQYVEDLADFTVERGEKNPTPEERENVRRSVNVTFTVKDDGTWTTKGGVMAMPINDAGTWTLEGEAFQITWTMQHGRRAQIRRSVTGTFTGDTIKIRPDPRVPMTFRRASE